MVFMKDNTPRTAHMYVSEHFQQLTQAHRIFERNQIQFADNDRRKRMWERRESTNLMLVAPYNILPDFHFDLASTQISVCWMVRTKRQIRCLQAIEKWEEREQKKNVITL